MPVNLIISFNVSNKKLPSFKKIMNDVKANLPNIKGCRSVKIFNHTEDPLQFTLIECWDSKEIHGAYVEELVASGKWNFIAEHLQENPVSGYYSEI